MVAEKSNRIFVIQSAGRKAEDGYLRGNAGRQLVFVADPAKAPALPDVRFAHPDDLRPDGRSWRQYLVDYNARDTNPIGLHRAIDLYAHPVYAHLASRLPPERLYVLSPAWGLVRADYRLPNYEVSFSHGAHVPVHARRAEAQTWQDFNTIEAGAGDEIVFIGSKDYLAAFDALTRNSPAQRLAYRSSGTGKGSPGLKFRRYEAKTKEAKNKAQWYYDLAYQLVPEA